MILGSNKLKYIRVFFVCKMKNIVCVFLVLFMYIGLIIQSIYIYPTIVRQVTFEGETRTIVVNSNTQIKDILEEMSYLYTVPSSFLSFYSTESKDYFIHNKKKKPNEAFLYDYINETHWTIYAKPTPQEHYYIYTLNAPRIKTDIVECHSDGICKITPTSTCHGLCINTYQLFKGRTRPQFISIDNKSIPYTDDFWLPDSTVIYNFL